MASDKGWGSCCLILSGMRSWSKVPAFVTGAVPGRKSVAVTRTACCRQGTSLRTACALGWDAAYLLPGCCDCFNDKALRAGRGAAFRLPLAGGTWRDLQRVLKANNLVPVAAHPHPKDSGGPTFPRVPRRCMCGSTFGCRNAAELDALHAAGADAFGELRQLDGVALVLGSEGQGLSDATLASCRRVSIPMHRMESLNVAVAGSILMWALRPADGKPV